MMELPVTRTRRVAAEKLALNLLVKTVESSLLLLDVWTLPMDAGLSVGVK
jgi:hypothetical protein